MEYIFVDEPIIPRRIDRRSWKLREIQQEIVAQKRAEFQENMPVETLVKMGFYDSKEKVMPFGIEVFSRNCTLKDTQHEWYERQVPTLAICLPREQDFTLLDAFRPSFWEDSKTHYWGFKTSAIPAIWSITHLLERLINLSIWEKFTPVPIRWKLGNDKALNVAKSAVEKINKGTPLGYQIPPPMKVFEKPTILEMYSRSRSSGSIQSFLRHEHTPYDYLWQTGVLPHDQAKEVFNLNLKRLYPDL